jgi:hypothetical protein
MVESFQPGSKSQSCFSIANRYGGYVLPRMFVSFGNGMSWLVAIRLFVFHSAGKTELKEIGGHHFISTLAIVDLRIKVAEIKCKIIIHDTQVFISSCVSIKVETPEFQIEEARAL